MSLSVVVNGPDFSSPAEETVEGSPTETKTQTKKAAVNRKYTIDFNSSTYHLIYKGHFLTLPKCLSELSCMIC